MKPRDQHSLKQCRHCDFKSRYLIVYICISFSVKQFVFNFIYAHFW